MDTPEGYRFVPSNGELISHCLVNKLLNREEPIHRHIIREIDVYRSNPHQLPLYEWRWSSEKEEYYFTTIVATTPGSSEGASTSINMSRIRRTEHGYWMQHGEDEFVTHGQQIVGFKKEFVFYTGNPPNGNQTKWVLSECRLLPSGLPEQYRNSSTLLARIQRTAVIRLKKMKFFEGDQVAAAQYENEEEFAKYEPKSNWHREN